jgi:hypothetical protein
MVALSHIVLKVLVIVMYSLSEVNGWFWDHIVGIPQIKSGVQKIYDFEGAHETHTNYDSTNLLRAIDHPIADGVRDSMFLARPINGRIDYAVEETIKGEVTNLASTSMGDIAEGVGTGPFRAVAAETSGDVAASRIVTGKDPCCIKKI